jgi:hypothetical protein
MSPHFDDKQESQYHTRQVPVEEGVDERDIGLTAQNVASGQVRITRAPADVRVESEPRGPILLQDDPDSTSLFTPDEASDLRSRWEMIQVGFVDEPRRAVEEADKLVASAIERLAQIVAAERTILERRFKQANDASTEDLRVALQHYRSFFSRLLSM